MTNEVMGFSDITIVCMSGFMGLSVFYCKEASIEHKPYAQYERATYVTYKQPRKRKYRRMVLGYEQQVAVFAGKVEFSNMTDERVENGVSTSCSKHSSGSKEWDNEFNNLCAANRTKLLYAQDRSGKRS